MGLTLGDTLSWAARYLPIKEAIVISEAGQARQSWTFAGLNDEVNRHAHALRGLGVEKGDVVAAFLSNSPSLVFTLLAAARLGAVFSPVNHRLDAQALAFILEDCKAKALVFDADGAQVVERARALTSNTQHWVYVGVADVPAAQCATVRWASLLRSQPIDEPAADVREDDACILSYTNGTGGRPKGVIHTHRTKLAHNALVQHTLLLRRADVGLCLGALSQCEELQSGFLPRLQLGITQVLQREFDAVDAVRLMRQEGVTTFFANPWMLSELLKAPDLSDQFLKRLRLVAYGGASLPPSHHRRWQAQVGTALVQMYGTAELGPCMAVLYPDAHQRSAGAAGQPALGHDVVVARIGEGGLPADPSQLCDVGQVGEVLVRSPYMMAGYLNRADDNARALAHGWFHTGDVGEWDANGVLWLRGRLDSMRASARIAPEADVDQCAAQAEALNQH